LHQARDRLRDQFAGQAESDFNGVDFSQDREKLFSPLWAKSQSFAQSFACPMHLTLAQNTDVKLCEIM
jgi:hypothetical protein